MWFNVLGATCYRIILDVFALDARTLNDIHDWINVYNHKLDFNVHLKSQMSDICEKGQLCLLWPVCLIETHPHKWWVQKAAFQTAGMLGKLFTTIKKTIRSVLTPSAERSLLQQCCWSWAEGFHVAPKRKGQYLWSQGKPSPAFFPLKSVYLWSL